MSADPVQDFLYELGDRGLWLSLDVLDRPRLRVDGPLDRLTPELRALLIEQEPILLRLLGGLDRKLVGDPELARRVRAFGLQIEAWVTAGAGAVPLLVLPEAPAQPTPGACVSCGGPAPESCGNPGRPRCSPCERAVALVLTWPRCETP